MSSPLLIYIEPNIVVIVTEMHKSKETDMYRCVDQTKHMLVWGLTVAGETPEI